MHTTVSTSFLFLAGNLAIISFLSVHNITNIYNHISCWHLDVVHVGLHDLQAVLLDQLLHQLDALVVRRHLLENTRCQC